MPALPLNKKEYEFTYGDYCNWNDDKRCELIYGAAYDMTPAPSIKHQSILGEIFRQISNYLVNKTCQVFVAPFDVRLPEHNETDDEVPTVVQPDIVVTCDKSKLDSRGLRGAPDMVIEVLSPATLKKDMTVKLNLYEHHKIKEYWIVNPNDKNVMVFILGKNKKYSKPSYYFSDDKPQISIFEDLTINLRDVFKK